MAHPDYLWKRVRGFSFRAGVVLESRRHWDQVYASRRSDEVSWHQSDPRLSLELVEATGLDLHESIIDVGGGASLVVDRLLDRGYDHVAVLDISDNALQESRTRLGERSVSVEWFTQDVLTFQSPHPWSLWHDRAVFHFLTRSADRDRYRQTLYRSVDVGGHVIIATFGPDGPVKCSGLPTLRCTGEEIAAHLGSGVELVEARIDAHTTPSGSVQQFVYARCIRV